MGINLLICPLLLAVAFAGLASRSIANETNCGRMISYQRGFELIGPTRKLETIRLTKDQSIQCGSTAFTRHAPAQLELSSGAVLHLGRQTNLELVADGTIHLHQGQFRIQGAGLNPVVLTYTPQAKVRFSGGMTLVEVDAKSARTTVAVFHGSTEFQNRFEESASQTVLTGYLSRLGISDNRLLPSRPQVMSPEAVASVLSELAVDEAEKKEMMAVVDRVVETKAKSLGMELESWRRIEKQQEGRSLASETKKDTTVVVVGESIEVIQEREAAETMKKFRKRILGPLADPDTNDED